QIGSGRDIIFYGTRNSALDKREIKSYVGCCGALPFQVRLANGARGVPKSCIVAHGVSCSGQQRLCLIGSNPSIADGSITGPQLHLVYKRTTLQKGLIRDVPSQRDRRKIAKPVVLPEPRRTIGPHGQGGHKLTFVIVV